MILYISEKQTPYGTMVAGSTCKGLSILSFDTLIETEKYIRKNISGIVAKQDKLYNNHIFKQLDEYFEGARQQFSLDLDLLTGTNFQRRVWIELFNIPYATTITYQQLASRVESSNYARAVGQANHHNPISIIIPCHRVVASDGSLGGYAGGIEKKRQLIFMEKSFSTNTCP